MTIRLADSHQWVYLLKESCANPSFQGVTCRVMSCQEFSRLAQKIFSAQTRSHGLFFSAWNFANCSLFLAILSPVFCGRNFRVQIARLVPLL